MAGDVYDLYARLSVAPNGQVETVKWQIELMTRELTASGDIVGRVFTDNGKSAWNRRVRRDGFEDLFANIAKGKTTRVMLYHFDRYMRQPRDLERMIDAVEESRGQLLIRDLEGRYDFGNARDRSSLRDSVRHACLSSDDTSRRVKDAHRRNLEKGILHGGRSYGLNSDGTPHETEAEVVREVARRRLAGETWTAIAEDLGRRGVRTIKHRTKMADGSVKVTGGVPFTRSSLRTMMAKPRLAGYVVLNDVVSPTRLPNPVLDQQTWDSLTALNDAGRRENTGGIHARYLLTGRIWCDGCNRWMHGSLQSDPKASLAECRHCGQLRTAHPVRGTSRPCPVDGPESAATEFAGLPRRVYRCVPDGVVRCARTITAIHVEEVVAEYVKDALRNQHYHDQIARAVSANDDREAVLRAQIARAESALADLTTNWGLGVLQDEGRYRKAALNLTTQIRDKQAQLDEIAQAPTMTAAAHALASDRQWDKADDRERRMFVEALVARIVIHARQPGRPPRYGVDVRRISVELVRPHRTDNAATPTEGVA